MDTLFGEHTVKKSCHLIFSTHLNRSQGQPAIERRDGQKNRKPESDSAQFWCETPCCKCSAREFYLSNPYLPAGMMTTWLQWFLVSSSKHGHEGQRNSFCEDCWWASFSLLGMKSFQSEHGPVYQLPFPWSRLPIMFHHMKDWRTTSRDVCTQASRSTGVDKLSDYFHTVGGSCLKYLLLYQCPPSSQLATWSPQGPPKRWSRSNPAAGIPSMPRRHDNWNSRDVYLCQSKLFWKFKLR